MRYLSYPAKESLQHTQGSCQQTAKAKITERGVPSDVWPTDLGALTQPLPQGRFWLTFPSPPTQACRKV